MEQLFVPFVKDKPDIPVFLKHPIFQLLGCRRVIADHSYSEEKLLQKWVQGRQTVVEIGVAEGGSARALREVSSTTSNLYLVDPYLSGRIPGLNFTKLIAHRYINRCSNANVFWIEKFSFDAVQSWNQPIDFLFIDGDHSYEGCLRDWQDWSPFVVENGIVVFHDARIFEGGWTRPEWGSVKVVDELFRKNKFSDWKIVEEVDSLVVVEKFS